MNHEETFYASLSARAGEYVAQLGIPLLDGKMGPDAESLGLRSDTGYTRSYKLKGITAYIEVSGFVQGCFLLSAGQELANVLVTKYMMIEVTEAEIPQYALEVMAEIANIIVGNSLINREEHDIFVGNPLMIVAHKAEIKPRAMNVYQTEYQTAYGSYQCIFVPMDKTMEMNSLLAIEVD